VRSFSAPGGCIGKVLTDKDIDDEIRALNDSSIKSNLHQAAERSRNVSAERRKKVEKGGIMALRAMRADGEQAAGGPFPPIFTMLSKKKKGD